MTSTITPDSAEIHLSATLDDGLAARAALGLIVLASDQTLEYEWRRIVTHPGVAFFESRLYNSPDIQPESLASMVHDIAGATGLLLPGLPLDVVAFGCTSGTIVIGEEQVFARIRETRPGIACTSPITGAMAALRALDARRICLVTPYVASVNQLFRRHIEERGVAVSDIASFHNPDDHEVARITHASLLSAVERCAQSDCDAIFVSCTSLRMVDVLAEAESRAGKPVISSNAAMAWHALRLAGIDDPQPQFGRLFTL